jgi:hypothetical protein
LVFRRSGTGACSPTGEVAFAPCAPFHDYGPSRSSTFMTLPLDDWRSRID